MTATGGRLLIAPNLLGSPSVSKLSIHPGSRPGSSRRVFWDESTSPEARRVIDLLQSMDRLVRAVAQGDVVHFARSRTGWKDVPETGVIWAPMEDVDGPFKVYVGPGANPVSAARAALDDSLVASVMDS